LAESLNNRAVIYSRIGNQTKALDCFNKSNHLYIEIEDSNGIAMGYYNISSIYRDKDDLQRAQEYLDKALTVARRVGNPDVLSNVLNSMAGLRKELGNQDGALATYCEALSISRNAEDKMTSALILNNLGVIYKEIGDLKEAKKYYERAYKISIANNASFKSVFILVNIAEYYYLIKDYKKAFELADEALKKAVETSNDEAKYDVIIVLIQIFEEQKNWEKTVYYQKKLIECKERKEKQIIEQISQYETILYKLEKDQFEVKSREVEAKLKREKEIQRGNFYYAIFIIILVVLLAFLLTFYLRLRSSRVKNKNITKQSEERKLLLQEIHHRVKNNFQIVSSMLRLQSYGFDNEELRQNFEEAVNRINAMAIVHDVIYRQEKFSDIDAKTYLEKLIGNLHKMGDSRITISIDSEEIPFKIETLINLGIALNELITNSFKHAFDDNILNPKIKISLRTIEEKSYELNYKDNGVGINEDTYKSNFGMELIETIIDNFDGEVLLAKEKDWNTVIRITFKEF
jgi:two-component sensor histidine kinase